MKKYKKYMFFMAALIMLLITVSAVSATDDTSDNSIISESPTDTTVEPQVTTTSSDTTIKNNNKIINKTMRENVKTATKTVEVNNFTELTTAINSAVEDADNDEYIINLNEGIYNLTSTTRLNKGTYQPNIIINGNQQNLVTSSKWNYFYFNNGCNITIKNTIINQYINVQDSSMTFNIVNSTLNNSLSCSGNLTIDDNTVAGEGFVYSHNGNIYTNNTAIKENLNNQGYYIDGGNVENKNITVLIRNYGNMVINNSNTVAISNYGNLTVINTTITKGSLTYGTSNHGNLTFIDSTINFTVENRGNMTSINSVFNDQPTNQGYFEFINSTATKTIINRGNFIFNNSTYYQIANNLGNLTLTNCTLSNLTIRNNRISNSGTLIICDDVVFCPEFRIDGNGVIVYSNPQELVPYLLEFNGNYIIENATITEMKTNRANLTIRNSTMNARFDNYGNLTICDDVTFGQSCQILELGDTPIIINDTSRIVQYVTMYYGDYLLENYTLTTQRTNKGNLTIRNSVINDGLINQGTLILENSTLGSSCYISNSGTLILGDNITLGGDLSISGNGEVITNDTDKFAPYLPTYTGNMVLENLTINSDKTNKGNLTIRNCTISRRITNNGNLTIENSTIAGQITNSGNLYLKNSTINQRITNNGNLTIDDDMEFGASFSISGSGHIYASDMAKLFPYIAQFYEEATVEVGTYTKTINNYGKLTIENSTLSGMITNYASGELTLKNTTTTIRTTNAGRMELNNATVNNLIQNSGTLIISDDTILGPNFSLSGNGQIIINDTQRVADYLSTYTGNIVLTNKTISTSKINNGNLTLNNCTITAIITNNGQITIDENTVFSGNGKIAGNGEIITDNITRILPYIDTINGNYTITDTTLNKSYTFKGNITLNNCTITKPENDNLGTLYLNGCNVDVGADNIFLNNLGTVYVDKNTHITGQIENIGGETNFEPTYEPKTIVVTNKTLKYYFDAGNAGKLSDLVNPGDTLDFQGAIGGVPNLNNLCVNKPVNIISSTKDAYVCLNTTNGDLSGSNPGNMFSIVKEGAYTNVTGIYFFNTQLWLYNTDHVTLDNISAVVDGQSVGSGVGQTSIRANSTYITVKNSYFFTRKNGGSSTLVLAYANYCTIVNNTIVGGGGCGNLLYLTTYNVDVPRDAVYNSYNVLANNTLEMTAEATSICWGIVLSGKGNIVDNNQLTFNGTGINFQWGSGSGSGEGAGLYNISDNIISNNKLYGTCGIAAGDIIYNNYVENGNIVATDAVVYNNTATSLNIKSGNCEITNNTINGNVTLQSGIETALIENNIINGNISIPNTVSNATFIGNNITGSVTLDGSDNVFINNSIITDDEYTITSKKLCMNNIIRDNYLVAQAKGGDDTVKLKDASNIIENNLPITTNINLAAQTETKVNSTIPITIILTAQDNLLTGQEVTITSNTINETIQLTQGVIIYQYTPSTIGEDTITVTFNSIDDYLGSTANATITVTEDKDAIIEELSQIVEELTSVKTTSIKLDTIEQAKVGDKVSISGKLSDEKGYGVPGTIKLLINNGRATVKTNANGDFTYEYTLTKVGSYEVQASYLGTSDYEASNTTMTFDVAQQDTIIIIDEISEAKIGNNVTITGKLVDANGNAIVGNVKLLINSGRTTVKTDSNGVFTYTFKTGKLGTNNITATYLGNTKYLETSAATTVEVIAKDTQIIFDDIASVKKGEKVTISGKLLDEDGNAIVGTIKLLINGGRATVKTNADGVFTYEYTANKVGTLEISASYLGATRYTATNATTTAEVAKLGTKITFNGIGTVKQKTMTTISGNLKDENGNAITGTVKLLINNGKATVKTDSTGAFTYSYNATRTGVNTVTATYLESASYLASEATTSFTVEKA